MEKIKNKNIYLCLFLAVILLFSCVFLFTGCGDNNDTSTDGDTDTSSVTRIQLTVNNISRYLGINYSVEKTKYNSNTIANYVNHVYSVETYSLGEYRFVNLVIEIGVTGAKDQNRISENGYGSFFFVRNGPLQPFMSPTRPVVKRVVSGYVEV